MTFAFYGPTNLENFTMSNNNGFIDVKNEISVSTWKNHTNRSYTQTPYMFIENDKRKSLINYLIYQQAFLLFFSICYNLDWLIVVSNYSYFISNISLKWKIIRHCYRWKLLFFPFYLEGIMIEMYLLRPYDLRRTKMIYRLSHISYILSWRSITLNYSQKSVFDYFSYFCRKRKCIIN